MPSVCTFDDMKGTYMHCYSPRLVYDPADAKYPWWQGCLFYVACGAPTSRPGGPLIQDVEMPDFPIDSHYTTSNITIAGKEWELDEPPLNIIAQIHTEPIPVPRIHYMSYGSLSFSSDYLRDSITCQLSDHYHWGFSSLLLLVFCLLTAVFAAPSCISYIGTLFGTARLTALGTT